ncbi:hypothetical protein JCM3770_005525 [Rhodotorula araucariae]
MPNKPPAASDSPARSSEGGPDPLLEFLAQESAEAKKHEQAQVAALRARAQPAARLYADECSAAVNDEEGRIKARLETYRAEDARLAGEARETEVALLELLQRQASDIKLVIAAVQDEREKLGAGSARVAESVERLAAEHNKAIAEEADKVWLLEEEEGEVEKGRRMEVDEYSA